MQKGFAGLAEPAPTFAEELASSVTHGLGLILSVAGLVVLIVLAVMQGEISHVVGCSIFGGTLVFMYAASTLYHSCRGQRIKRIFRIIDHIAIYLLIAGTYTPFLLILFTGILQTAMLTAIWGMALLGTVFKLSSPDRFSRASTFLYLAMGWMVVLALGPLLEVTPPRCLLWMLGGGLLYTGGVAFYLWEQLPFHHAIWHVFVLGGSTCHYCAVTFYILP